MTVHRSAQTHGPGADLLLQVRCAIYNGTLGAGFGHQFNRIANPDLTFAKAA
jgi:hypothetical protein